MEIGVIHILLIVVITVICVGVTMLGIGQKENLHRHENPLQDDLEKKD